MEIPGLKVSLHSVARSVTSPAAGETTAAVYHRGDPEFDVYQQEEAAFREKARLMTQQENGLPKNFYGPSSEGTERSGTQLARQIGDAFVQFYRGDLDEKALERVMSDTVADLRSAYISKGYDEAEFMPQLIEDAYNAARLYNIRGAGTASWYDGIPLAAAQGGNQKHGWIYYDADYYYQSEEMKGTLQDIAGRIAQRYGVNPSRLELPAEYPQDDIRRSIYGSYNTYISFRGRDQTRICSIIDETMAPPKGLRFFYNSNQTGSNQWVPNLPAPRDEPEAAFDGVLQVWYGDWSFTGRVPVRQNPYQFPASVNMFGVVSEGSASGIPEEIVDFLHNVDFFTIFLSGDYNRSHPRRY